MTDDDLLFFKTSGFSMRPFLKEGEKLVIKKTAAKDLRIGDIILYRLDNRLVCHRLIKKTKGYSIYTRGDNCDKSDGPISQDAVLGAAIAVMKNNHLISLTGWRRFFLNPLIAVIAPFLKFGVRVIKPLVKR